jgi:hypothetical protein
MVQHTSKYPRLEWRINEQLWQRGRNVLVFVALVSWLLAGVGALLNPNRFFESYLVGFLYAVSLPLGALFFVMVQYLTGSAWSVPMRRLAEHLMVSVGIGPLLFIPVLAGMHHLYEWSHAEVVARDHLLQHKAGYLNPQWFTIRAAIYFFVWIILATRIYSHSTRQDRTGALEHMHGASRWSAPGLLFTTVTVTLAAFDWIMSLNPHWYSTIFGVYFFAGAGWAFMAAWTWICLRLRDEGVLADVITVEHYHDLGKWMFALTVFWTYIAFSQYLLIWYANLPEETIFYKMRFEGSWKLWSALLLVGHFIVPFLTLISRPAKRNLKVLRVMATWILAIHFVDLYWLMMPNFHRSGVSLHWLDAVCLGAPLSLVALVFWFQLRKHALMPIGDPRFELGLEFHNV